MRDRLRVQRAARPSPEVWHARRDRLVCLIAAQLERWRAIPPEEKPGGVVVLRFVDDVGVDGDVAAFAARFRFARAGSSGQPGGGRYTHHLLGREVDLSRALSSLAAARMGGPGWAAVLAIADVDRAAPYAYPTDFPGRYMAHVYVQIPGWREALQHCVERLGGAVAKWPRETPGQSAWIGVDVPASRLDAFREFPVLHSVQGQHRIGLRRS